MSKSNGAGYLKVYAPESEFIEEDRCRSLRLWSEAVDVSVLADSGRADDSVPMILKWRGKGAYSRPVSALELLARTRAIYRNRHCRACRSPVVEPVSQDDAQLNRNLMPIPGTATLTGFRCQSCRTEWSV